MKTGTSKGFARADRLHRKAAMNCIHCGIRLTGLERIMACAQFAVTWAAAAAPGHPVGSHREVRIHGQA